VQRKIQRMIEQSHTVIDVQDVQNIHDTVFKGCDHLAWILNNAKE